MTTTFPTIEKQSPPLRVDADGTIRVGSSRITLDQLIQAYHLGQSPEYFAQSHAPLSLAEIYGAIWYYLLHKEEVDVYLQQRSERAKERWRVIDADPANRRLAEKLKAATERQPRS